MLSVEFEDSDSIMFHNEATLTNTRVTHNISTQDVRGGYDNFNSDAFFSCVCVSRRTKSSDFARFRSPSSDFPIGWLIPALYFSEPEQFEERYLSDFAYAGFIHFWQQDANKACREFFALNSSPEECRFSDILPEDCSIAVFSKEQFKKSKLDFASLKVSLLKHGVWPIDGELPPAIFYENSKNALVKEEEFFSSDSQSKNIKTYFVSKSCKDVDRLLISLVTMAHKDMTGVGGFLYLFQIYEYMMEVSFSEAVAELSKKQLKAWSLKKKLNEAAAESVRLRKIANKASDAGASSLIFDALGRQCFEFVKCCGEVSKEDGYDDKMWIEWVYKVRNLAVHNHLGVLRCGAHSSFSSVNALLHLAVIEMLLFY